MPDVAERVDGEPERSAAAHEEFPGSVGRTPAIDAAAIDASPSGVSLTGGQAFLVAAAGISAALAVVACLVVLVRIGADENRGGAAVAGAGPVTELTVDASDFAFDPASAELLAGEELTVTMDNVGSVEHEWIVLNQGVRLTDEADFTEDMVLARTDRVGGGETATVNFTIDESGTYQVVCLVAGHLASGMQGTVTVSS
ncbi:MAG: plastocyanin/azurin family copper-binding protein [Actinomycetota bacterium]